MRIGQGFDAHRFVEGRKLMLGGVEVPYERGLAGHSDGDVLLHAIIDALLGAAALGDIGAMFPSSDDRWKDANSLDLLLRARTRVREAGFRIANVDATVIAEAPKVAPQVMVMRRTIAQALQIDITDVSVKGTTADGMGFTGEGEGVAASAVVLLE
ncbi:MAG: 2-C-methyl-D-erythritol 2,4-cyclodiphosphate synthase [Dehalococcoidia bacterium]